MYGSGMCFLGSGMLGGFSIIPMLFWGFVIYYFFIKPNGHNCKPVNIKKAIEYPINLSPMEILDRSFALGEISETEYLRKKDLLRQ